MTASAFTSRRRFSMSICDRQIRIHRVSRTLSRHWLQRPPPSHSISLIVDSGRTDKERVIWGLIYRNRNKRTAKERRLQKLAQKWVADMLSATQKKVTQGNGVKPLLKPAETPTRQGKARASGEDFSFFKTRPDNRGSLPRRLPLQSITFIDSIAYGREAESPESSILGKNFSSGS